MTLTARVAAAMHEHSTISAARAARLIGRSHTVVVELIKAGKLRATDERRPGAQRPRYRIEPDEITRWRMSCEVQPETQPERRQQDTVVVPVTGEVRRRLERMRRTR
jgi:hypothetical protein